MNQSLDKVRAVRRGCARWSQGYAVACKETAGPTTGPIMAIFAARRGVAADIEDMLKALRGRDMEGMLLELEEIVRRPDFSILHPCGCSLCQLLSHLRGPLQRSLTAGDHGTPSCLLLCIQITLLHVDSCRGGCEG